MSNTRIATSFERVADLLAQQGASAHRVRAWRDGARTLRTWPREVGDVFREHGRAGLEALPHVGPRLASVIIETLRTGHCAILDRLHGDASAALEHLPGLGSCLAQRIQRELGVETTEELEVAAHDGRLASVPGFGPRRIAALQAVLEARSRWPIPGAAEAPRPPVALLLDVDRRYREAAEAGRLPVIAPRRFNPHGVAWLPVMHVEQGGLQLTALYSNTALAHRLGRTRDWVVIEFHEPEGPDGRATVVTEWRGALAGHRVVRGREDECELVDHGAAYQRAS